MSHAIRPSGNGTFWSYLTGYLFSILFTIDAYVLVVHRTFSTRRLELLVAGLAIAQFFVQVLFFLHLGTEKKPRWKLLVFLFMVMIVLILVFGSLWIMSNLNYRMTPQQINNYLNNQNGI